MSRRLVVFFDGTWNKVATGTNVERLRTLVAAADAGGRTQVCRYFAGVGVKPGLEHWLGGAFGLGLSDNVKDGYQWLSQNWQPGDEIWLFGFSRGAYTARSLGGVIRKCGLAAPAAGGTVTRAAIDEAYAYYRNKQEVPGDVSGGADPTEVWRRQHAARDVLIRFVGVWDTVGDLGVPGVGSWFPFARSNYGFHDTDLSKIVQYAYQALALDEHRADFAPTKWVRPARTLAPGEKATAWKAEQVEVEQRWFVGAHADVGGGETADGAGQSPDTLPEIALAWLQCKAIGAGLAFNAPFPHQPSDDAELAAPNDSYGAFMGGIYKMLKKPFQRPMGGGVNETIDASVWKKWGHTAPYRPPSLQTALDAGVVRMDSDRVG